MIYSPHLSTYFPAYISFYISTILIENLATYEPNYLGIPGTEVLTGWFEVRKATLNLGHIKDMDKGKLLFSYCSHFLW